MSTTVITKKVLIIEDSENQRENLRKLFAAFFEGVEPEFAVTSLDIKQFTVSGLDEYESILVDVHLDNIGDIYVDGEIAADGIDLINLLFDKIKQQSIIIYSGQGDFQKTAREKLGNRFERVECAAKNAIFSTDPLVTFQFFFPIVSKFLPQSYTFWFDISGANSSQLSNAEIRKTISSIFPDRIFGKNAINKEYTSQETSLSLDLESKELQLKRKIVLMKKKIPTTGTTITILNGITKDININLNNYSLANYHSIFNALKNVDSLSDFNKHVILHLGMRNLMELFLQKQIGLEEINMALTMCGDHRILFQYFMIKRFAILNPRYLKQTLEEMSLHKNFYRIVEFYEGNTNETEEGFTHVTLTPFLNGKQQSVDIDLETAWLKAHCIEGEDRYFHYLIYEGPVSESIYIQSSDIYELNQIPL